MIDLFLAACIALLIGWLLGRGLTKPTPWRRATFERTWGRKEKAAQLDRLLSLDEFMALLRPEVDAFEDNCRDGQRETPDLYPGKMKEAEWRDDAAFWIG